jgi:hypothetical protein
VTLASAPTGALLHPTFRLESRLVLRAPEAPTHPGKPWLLAVFLLVLGAAVRLPFLAESLAVPVDGDTGVVGLMALNHVIGGTMWGQPYGSPVESWLVLPFIEVLGPTRLAIRVAYFFLSLALVPLAYHLARALHPAAGLPAALLVACPPAVLLAYSAVPQPLYPATLILVAACLLAALAADTRLESGRRSAYCLFLMAWSGCAALAVWTHSVSLFAVGASAAVLLWRARRDPRHVAFVLAATALAVLPALLLLSTTPGASGVLAGSLDHARRVVPRMPLTLSELLGGRIMAVAGLEKRIVSPVSVQVVLAAGYVGGALAALRCRRRHAVLMLMGVVALTMVGFPFPLRSGVGAIRFLTPAYVPLVTLATAGAARRSPATAWALAGVLAALHLLPVPALLASWRREAPFNSYSPDCTAPRVAMEVLGIRRGYASYNTAYCITYESGEHIVMSQPWNERFPHPLPYLDEVRFAVRAAWVLRPADDFGMPTPEHFESLLQSAGGTWQRWDRAGFSIYHSFVPPFPDTGLPTVARSCDSGLVLDFPRPEGLTGITVLAGPSRTLPARLTVEVSADGHPFETVWSRRRPRALTKLTWLVGNPRFPIDPIGLGIPFPEERTVARVRVTSEEADPCVVVGTVLGHGVRDRPPESDWIDPDTSWPERRQLLSQQAMPDRASWHYRRLVAEAHR